MKDDGERPIQGITSAEAAEILGIRRSSVDRLVMRGVLHRPAKHARRSLDRDEVERLALERYKPGPPYWATTAETAELLGISEQRVGQLVHEARLPAFRHGTRWLFRRHQVEVIGNARDALWRVTAGT